MSIKVTILIAIVGLLAVQSFGHRGHGEGDGRGNGGGFGFGGGRDRRNPFEFDRIRNATCSAKEVSQPATPPCTTCICYPDNVLNCWTLKPRFCNSTATAPAPAPAPDAGAA